ncbi:hypothetical protein BpHYR1_001078 [Brachionus plicatilis]|uniref:Uncharacterized protein n=1 Tax=Brachionus plicatilis TaxID=10195 RepID=A0A3M7S6G3_BRAPC|nr:hypothetical protein BpHYR1_001078 [Brachionus plicatilis]
MIKKNRITQIAKVFNFTSKNLNATFFFSFFEIGTKNITELNPSQLHGSNKNLTQKKTRPNNGHSGRRSKPLGFFHFFPGIHTIIHHSLAIEGLARHYNHSH